ncbi:MAG: HDOD domain-containing protein [Spirochaetales bacterium]|nr:HDOD domain-containing protein [Spirochaetales bacterium]
MPIRRREEYFISGLLHDVGKVAIAGCFLDKYFEAIEKANNEEIPLFEAEKSVFNFDHQNVGLLITNHWRLEGGIKDAIGHHHDTDSYEGEYKTMVYAVCIADYISMYLKIGNAGNTELIKPSDKVFEHLGISLEEIAAANEGLYAEIEKARVFLNLSH